MERSMQEIIQIEVKEKKRSKFLNNKLLKKIANPTINTETFVSTLQIFLIDWFFILVVINKNKLLADQIME